MVASNPATGFESTHEFAFFDYFRIPYFVRERGPGSDVLGSRRDVLGALQPSDGDGPRLVWWRGRADHAATTRAGRFQLAGFTIAGHVVCAEPGELLPGPGGDWRPNDAVVDPDGRPVAAVWQRSDGTVFLPFDPGEVMLNLWSERYATLGRRGVGKAVRAAMLRTYYLLRPLLPRRLQIQLRQAFAARQNIPDFPRWPLEPSLHDLYDWLFDLITSVTGRSVPYIDIWPAGKAWAFVLTHDVETDVGVAARELLRAPERRHGYRSSWNFVPERYELDPEVVRQLEQEDCEIGVHGLRHDGRDLVSKRVLSKRLPAMRAAANRWHAVGFRSPATQRHWELMPRLGFDYDCSYTDTDPYEPQPGGCCTFWPFFNADLVELPITLPQDHTLFRVLRDVDPELWSDKAREIRKRGGMVLVLAHPDYADDPEMQRAWERLLEGFAHDSTMWQALPREVSTWWRARAESRLVNETGEWTISGPAAANGRIRFRTPSSSEHEVRS